MSTTTNVITFKLTGTRPLLMQAERLRDMRAAELDKLNGENML